MITKLIVMIILGLISAALTAYRKNYYVRIFEDILAQDEEKDPKARLGKSFVYGFLFPIFFAIGISLVAVLVAFLIAAGIMAGIIFVLVWITEKIIPNAAIGDIVESLFEKIGIKGAPPAVEAPSVGAGSVYSPEPCTPPSTTSTTAPTGSEKKEVCAQEKKEEPAEDDSENPFPGGNINRNRRHSLD